MIKFAIETMRNVIFKHWTFFRCLRLALGIAILIQAVITEDILFACAGIIFTAMPVFNLGCCGTSGCAAPPPAKHHTSKEIQYEEVD